MKKKKILSFCQNKELEVQVLFLPLVAINSGQATFPVSQYIHLSI